MTTPHKPLLAASYDEKTLEKQFATGMPLLVSAKLDGIRATIQGIPLARSLKPIPNKYLQAKYSAAHLQGLDGEFIAGEPNSPTVYRDTFSAVMTIAGEPENVRLFVFDHLESPKSGYLERYAKCKQGDGVVVVPQKMVKSVDEVLAFEQNILEQGYEGAMIRHPNAPYKFGRSTARELILMKLKREIDEESKVIDIYEAMTNNNEAFTNELGYTDRSTHAENLEGSGIAGGFVLEKDGLQFRCSMGRFDHSERREIWENRDKYLGKLVKYRYFGYGVKEAPRHPRALGWRSEVDM